MGNSADSLFPGAGQPTGEIATRLVGGLGSSVTNDIEAFHTQGGELQYVIGHDTAQVIDPLSRATGIVSQLLVIDHSYVEIVRFGMGKDDA